MTSSTRIDEDDSEGRREADLALEEREDVDLDPGNGRRVARSAAGRDIHDVERGERGDRP